MTALLLGSTSSGPTASNAARPALSRRRPAGPPTARPSDSRARAWATPSACSPADRAARTSSRPSASAAGSRLYWTPRGLAVLVLAVALVAAVMTTTVVLAFLAVSDAPPATPTGSALSAVVPDAPGRA